MPGHIFTVPLISMAVALINESFYLFTCAIMMYVDDINASQELNMKIWEVVLERRDVHPKQTNYNPSSYSGKQMGFNL